MKNIWLIKNSDYVLLYHFIGFFFIKIPQELLSCKQSALENRFIHQEVLHPYPDLYIF